MTYCTCESPIMDVEHDAGCRRCGFPVDFNPTEGATVMFACNPDESAGLADVKYPEIEVQLSGTDGNAFAIIGTVTRALRRAGVSADEVSAFTDDATSGDYDHVLQTAMRWVDVS